MTTSDGPWGRRLLERIHERGIRLDAVVVMTGGIAPPRDRRSERTTRRLRRWPRATAGAVKRRVSFRRDRRAWYAARARQVIPAAEMNSRALRRTLARLDPDYLVLGGGGILEPDVIQTARAGVLNAHPALLPWVRGNGVVAQSLEHDVALGATVHMVDSGIDTGPIVARRLLPVEPGPASIHALEEAAYDLAAEIMADTVEAIARRGERPRGMPQEEQHPLFRKPADACRPAHEALAGSGRAYELFERWRAPGLRIDVPLVLDRPSPTR